MTTEGIEAPIDLKYMEQTTKNVQDKRSIEDEQEKGASLELDYRIPQKNRQLPRPSSFDRKVKKQDESLFAVVCAWIVEHQLGRAFGFSSTSQLIDQVTGLAMNLLLLLALTHLCFPRARRQTRKFFDLSYYNSSSHRYGLGWDDIFLVLFWIVVFTGLRVAVMDYILVPLAQNSGISKRKKKVRFAEQAWVLIYYGAFWSLGMV